VQTYTNPLLKLIEEGKIDPSFVVTHPASLEDAPAMYKKFRDKEDCAMKVVFAAGPVTAGRAQHVLLLLEPAWVSGTVAALGGGHRGAAFDVRHAAVHAEVRQRLTERFGGLTAPPAATIKESCTKVRGPIDS
jgi:hypothetical protein